VSLPSPLPHGLPNICRVYGNPFNYVDRKDAWESQILKVVPLKHRLPYAYGPSDVYRIRGHHLVVDEMADALMECLDKGVPAERLAYGGIYCWRAQRGYSQLSTHTWGIAIDLDPANNPLGKPWDGGDRMIHPTIVSVFEGRGFTWGGKWGRPDVMHFAACAAY